MLRVKLNLFDTKIDIMERKFHQLQNRQIYIEDDLTQREIGIVKKLRDVARSECSTGKNDRIGYRKLNINGAILEQRKLGVKG